MANEKETIKNESENTVLNNGAELDAAQGAAQGAATVAYKIVGVRAYDADKTDPNNKLERDLVTLLLNKPYKRMQQDQTTKLWVEIDTDQFTLSRYTLENYLMQFVEDVAYLIGDDSKLSFDTMKKLLVASDLVLMSTKHLMNEVINGKVLDRDQWFNEVVNIVLNKRATAFVEAMVNKMFEV